MSRKKQVEKIKDCIDSVYGSDCAYYGVDGFAIAEALYDAGYCRQNEWISVEDDTPKDGEKRVQVFLRDDDFTKPIGENKIDTDRFIDGKWVRWGKYVTHWMPLPEPPERRMI